MLLGLSTGQSTETILTDKRYVLKNYGNTQVLCDPYVVRKNDWIFKIFMQRGEIVEKNYDEFINIFKNINPSISNIDRIHPEQLIFLPLKKIEPGVFHDQTSDIVILPLVTISTPADTEPITSANHKPLTIPYEVKKGDSLSMIIMDHYGAVGPESYKQVIKNFNALNTSIVDINLIFPGQILRLPPEMPRARLLSMGTDTDTPPQDTERREAAAGLIRSELRSLPLAKVASMLNAKLLNKGIYHFPGETANGLKLDLSLYPIMIINHKNRLVFTKDYQLNNADLRILKSYWPDATAITIGSDASPLKIIDAVFTSLGKNASANAFTFSERGINVRIRSKWALNTMAVDTEIPERICITPVKAHQERTSRAIIDYLKDHDIYIYEIGGGNMQPLPVPKKVDNRNIPNPATMINESDPDTIIKTLVSYLGYGYDKNVVINYPYAGIIIKAVLNLISDDKGTLLFVDFGNFKVENIEVIRKMGFDIFQITPDMPLDTVISVMADMLKISHKANPIFHATNREDPYNIAITIPGYFLERGTLKIMVSRVPLPGGIMALLTERGINTVVMAGD